MSQALTVRNQNLHEIGLHSSIPSAVSKLRGRGALETQQRSDSIVSTSQLDGRWHSTGIADWASTVNLGVDFSLANSTSQGSYCKQQHSKSLPPCLNKTSRVELSEDQSDAFYSKMWSPQPSRVRVDNSKLSKIKREQAKKRRDQNRRSQQAYRERRTQYALSLETKVEEMDESLRRLQLENGELLQRLCDLRANNHTLRSSQTEPETSKDSFVSADLAESLARSGSEACIPLSKKELESLYEPYLAVWNLLSSYLRPESQPEDFAAILGYLQAMAVRRMQKSRQEATIEHD